MSTAPNTYETAQAIIPDARIAYIDNDRWCSPTCARWPSTAIPV